MKQQTTKPHKGTNPYTEVWDSNREEDRQAAPFSKQARMSCAADVPAAPFFNPPSAARYFDWLHNFQRSFTLRSAGEVLYRVKVSGEELWRAYLSSFSDPAERQYHNCHCCRQFIEQCGNLVTIDGGGKLHSAVWRSVEASGYDRFSAKLAHLVETSRVDCLAYFDRAIYGTARTGKWQHMHASLSPAQRTKCFSTEIALRKEAESRELFRMFQEWYQQRSTDELRDGEFWLLYKGLARADKFVEQASWLHGLRYASTNQTWRAIGTKPAAWFHCGGTVLDSLYADIRARKSDAEITANWNAKIAPDAYQRPKAAPAAGTIDRAERLFEELNLARSLERRFARFDEVPKLWVAQPREAYNKRTGLFANLRREAPANMPGSFGLFIDMTWEKFASTVLPNADQIELLTPVHGAYGGLLTAVHPDAPPLFAWDRSEARNPLSWYLWHGGSHATDFFLASSTFVQVKGITPQPNMPNYPSLGCGLLFILAGAYDSRQVPSGLFPECLRGELREVRSVIERYSNWTHIPAGREQTAGLFMQAVQRAWDHKLRVTVRGRVLGYNLQRWD